MIVNRLSRLLGERRFSVREVALGAGVAYSSLFELYHGRTKRIDLETLDKLCTYLEVTPNDIFEWVPAEEAGGELEVKALAA